MFIHFFSIFLAVILIIDLKMDQFWDDDFEDADIDECIMKASQMCPLPSIVDGLPTASKPFTTVVTTAAGAPVAGDASSYSAGIRPSMGGKASVYINDSEKQEIEALMQDHCVFDNLDGHIDLDLLSSQPIPGTQPQQRFLKNPIIKQLPGLKASGGSSSSNINFNSHAVSNATYGSTGEKVSGFIKPSTTTHNSGNKYPVVVESTAASSNIGSKSSQLMPPPAVNFNPNPLRGDQSSLSKQSFAQSRNLSSQIKPSNFYPSQVSKGNVSVHNSTFNSFQVSKLNNISPCEYADFNDFSHIVPAETTIPDGNLQQKLLVSQTKLSEIEKEIITKKGEVRFFENMYFFILMSCVIFCFI